jgi:hypothetical protein
MQNIHYKQLDLTRKDKEKIYLQKLQNQEYFIIGIEITDPEMAQYCHLNFDPQHSGNNYKSTALESVFNLKSDLKSIAKNFNDILLITIKSDLDSISSMSLITMVLKNTFELTGDLILRLKALSISDKHGMDDDWKPGIKYNDFNIPEYTKYGLPISLVVLIGDINLNINYKVKTMIEFLLYGEFKDNEKYQKINQSKQANIRDSTSVEIIIPNKLVYVESTYRGAIGYGYRKAPIVIAKNDKYSFGKKSNRILGIKYTIGQYNEQHIDLSAVQKEIEKYEFGWGGSPVIIGSPQTNPSIIKKEQLINIVKQIIKNNV